MEGFGLNIQNLEDMHSEMWLMQKKQKLLILKELWHYMRKLFKIIVMQKTCFYNIKVCYGALL